MQPRAGSAAPVLAGARPRRRTPAAHWHMDPTRLLIKNKRLKLWHVGPSCQQGFFSRKIKEIEIEKRDDMWAKAVSVLIISKCLIKRKEPDSGSHCHSLSKFWKIGRKWNGFCKFITNSKMIQFQCTLYQNLQNWIVYLMVWSLGKIEYFKLL